MRPTARGTGLLLGSGVLWMVGRLIGVGELSIVAAAAVCLVVAGAVAVRTGSAAVAVRRRLSTSRLHHGEQAEVRIDLRDEARWRRAPLMLVEDDCPWALGDRPRVVVAGLRPGASATVRYRITGSARGRYRVGPVRLGLRDPFGTVERVRRYHGSDEVVVYPRIEPLPAGVTHDGHRGTDRSGRPRHGSAGDEFHTLREYVPGDDLRLVHWRSSARRGKLLVRQRELRRESEATVFCDTRALAHRGAGPESTLERALSAAASVAVHLDGRGYRLRLLTDADERVPAVASCAAVLARLAELEASDRPGLAALAGRRDPSGTGLFVAVVAAPPGRGPVTDHPDSRALVRAGRRHPDRIAVVVYATGDAGRAGELARLLRASGWRATTLGVSEALPERWAEISATPRRPAAGVGRTR